MDQRDEIDRDQITFEQAEGAEPLPTQLALRELSQELRAFIWLSIYTSIQRDISHPRMGGYDHLTGDWKAILFAWHVYREFRFADDFNDDALEQITKAKRIIVEGDYLAVFGFLEFIIRHPNCPFKLKDNLKLALEFGRAAYRIEGRSIIPIASEAEAEAVTASFAAIRLGRFQGARAHLLRAGELLTSGSWSDSIRESIHAVESVITVLEPDAASFAKALSNLEKVKRIHPALKSGFGSLYGYTSDESGIRHPLVDEPVADVDETDALYMFGACASFITYLTRKSELAT